ncbi:MAG: hypothetical protein WBP03_00970 [Candidatus Saccharimonadales bacterium]
MSSLIPELVIESVNRMALDLFRAAELNERGLSGSATMLATSMPVELRRMGVDEPSIQQVVLNASTIHGTAQRDLSDRRLTRFIQGAI